MPRQLTADLLGGPPWGFRTFHQPDNRLVITQVIPHSAAEKAGLQPDDILISANGIILPQNVIACQQIIKRASGQLSLDVFRPNASEDSRHLTVVSEKPTDIYRRGSFTSQDSQQHSPSWLQGSGKERFGRRFLRPTPVRHAPVYSKEYQVTGRKRGVSSAPCSPLTVRRGHAEVHVEHEITVFSDNELEVKHQIPVCLDKDTEVKHQIPLCLNKDTEVKHQIPVCSNNELEVKHQIPVFSNTDTEVKHQIPVVSDNELELKSQDKKHQLAVSSDNEAEAKPQLTVFSDKTQDKKHQLSIFSDNKREVTSQDKKHQLPVPSDNKLDLKSQDKEKDRERLQPENISPGVQARIRMLEATSASAPSLPNQSWTANGAVFEQPSKSDLAKRVAELSRPESMLSDHPSLVSTTLDVESEVKSLSSAPTYIDGLANPLIRRTQRSTTTEDQNQTPNSAITPVVFRPSSLLQDSNRNRISEISVDQDTEYFDTKYFDPSGFPDPANGNTPKTDAQNDTPRFPSVTSPDSDNQLETQINNFQTYGQRLNQDYVESDMANADVQPHFEANGLNQRYKGQEKSKTAVWKPGHHEYPTVDPQSIMNTSQPQHSTPKDSNRPRGAVGYRPISFVPPQISPVPTRRAAQPEQPSCPTPPFSEQIPAHSVQIPAHSVQTFTGGTTLRTQQQQQPKKATKETISLKHQIPATTRNHQSITIGYNDYNRGKNEPNLYQQHQVQKHTPGVPQQATSAQISQALLHTPNTNDNKPPRISPVPVSTRDETEKILGYQLNHAPAPPPPAPPMPSKQDLDRATKQTASTSIDRDREFVPSYPGEPRAEVVYLEPQTVSNLRSKIIQQLNGSKPSSAPRIDDKPVSTQISTQVAVEQQQPALNSHLNSSDPYVRQSRQPRPMEAPQNTSIAGRTLNALRTLNDPFDSPATSNLSPASPRYSRPESPMSIPVVHDVTIARPDVTLARHDVMQNGFAGYPRLAQDRKPRVDATTVANATSEYSKPRPSANGANNLVEDFKSSILSTTEDLATNRAVDEAPTNDMFGLNAPKFENISKQRTEISIGGSTPPSKHRIADSQPRKDYDSSIYTKSTPPIEVLVSPRHVSTPERTPFPSETRTRLNNHTNVNGTTSTQQASVSKASPNGYAPNGHSTSNHQTTQHQASSYTLNHQTTKGTSYQTELRSPVPSITSPVPPRPPSPTESLASTVYSRTGAPKTEHPIASRAPSDPVLYSNAGAKTSAKPGYAAADYYANNKGKDDALPSRDPQITGPDGESLSKEDYQHHWYKMMYKRLHQLEKEEPILKYRMKVKNYWDDHYAPQHRRPASNDRSSFDKATEYTSELNQDFAMNQRNRGYATLPTRRKPPPTVSGLDREKGTGPSEDFRYDMPPRPTSTKPYGSMMSERSTMDDENEYLSDSGVPSGFQRRNKPQYSSLSVRNHSRYAPQRKDSFLKFAVHEQDLQPCKYTLVSPKSGKIAMTSVLSFTPTPMPYGFKRPILRRHRSSDSLATWDGVLANGILTDSGPRVSRIDEISKNPKFVPQSVPTLEKAQTSTTRDESNIIFSTDNRQNSFIPNLQGHKLSNGTLNYPYTEVHSDKNAEYFHARPIATNCIDDTTKSKASISIQHTRYYNNPPGPETWQRPKETLVKVAKPRDYIIGFPGTISPGGRGRKSPTWDFLAKRSKSAERYQSSFEKQLLAPEPYQLDGGDPINLAKYPSGKREESPIHRTRTASGGAVSLNPPLPNQAGFDADYPRDAMYSPVRTKEKSIGRFAAENIKVKDFHIPGHRAARSKEGSEAHEIVARARAYSEQISNPSSPRQRRSPLANGAERESRPPTRNIGTSTYIQNLKDYYDTAYRRSAHSEQRWEELYDATCSAAEDALRQFDHLPSATGPENAKKCRKSRNPNKQRHPVRSDKGLIRRRSMYRSCSLPLVTCETIKPGRYISKDSPKYLPSDSLYFDPQFMTERDYCFDNLIRKYRALDRKISDSTAQRCAKYAMRRFGGIKRVRSLPQINEDVNNGDESIGARKSSFGASPEFNSFDDSSESLTKYDTALVCTCSKCTSGSDDNTRCYDSIEHLDPSCPFIGNGNSNFDKKCQEIRHHRHGSLEVLPRAQDLEIWSDIYRKNWCRKAVDGE